MYPNSAAFALHSPDGEIQSAACLVLFAFSSAKTLSCTSLSRIAFCAARNEMLSSELLVCDDGGNELLRYSGISSPAELPGRRFGFSTFSVQGSLCGLSGGMDLLIPEHSRALALSGVELLCCFPSVDVYEAFPFDQIARVRAVENQIFTALVPPSGESVVCWGPTGAPLGSSRSDSGELFFVLRPEYIARARKKYPLRSLRKKQLRYALAAL